MEPIEKGLIEAGLEEKEAKVYLAILNLGKGSLTDVAEKAELKRTTVYQYVESLLAKNFIAKTAYRKRTLYVAEKPQKIIQSLERKKRRLEGLMPELDSIFLLASHKPKMSYYEGIEGVRMVYREMTSTSKTLYSLFSADKYFATMSEQDAIDYMENIKNSGGKLRDLVENTPAGREYYKSPGFEEFKVTKLLDKDFSLQTELLVTGDKVAMISLVNLVGVIIENQEIAQTQLKLIKFLWDKL